MTIVHEAGLRVGRGNAVVMAKRHYLVAARGSEDAVELIPRVDIYHTKPMHVAVKCSRVDEIETLCRRGNKE